MASIKPGLYSVSQLLNEAGFDISEAAADYLDGQPDHRRVKVGGLSFDSTDDKIVVPESATSVEVSLDGEVAETLTVEQA